MGLDDDMNSFANECWENLLTMKNDGWKQSEYSKNVTPQNHQFYIIRFDSMAKSLKVFCFSVCGLWPL